MVKKTIAMLLTALIIVSLAACGGSSKPTSYDIKTLSDAFAIEAENKMWSYSEDKFVFVTDDPEVMIRVTAKLTEDIYNQMEAIDFFDDDRESKIFEILAPVSVDKVEDLAKGIPSQKELDKLIGKTGVDLLAAGYEIDGWSGWDGSVHYSLCKGDYEYTFTMNEKVDMEADDFDGMMAFPDFTVKEVEYFGLSYHATDTE